MADRVFRDRRHAGGVLADLLAHHRGAEGVVVLGLARGGVPVAHEVADHLGARLDVFVVRKLGVPGQPELAMGAIASGEVLVLNEDLVRRLDIPTDLVLETAERETRELRRREAAYRGGRPVTDVVGRTVILVDDGLATGASMRAAVVAVRRRRPSRVVVAVPLAPATVAEELRGKVDEMVCAAMPSPFHAVGRWYQSFDQTTDEEVRDLLAVASRPRPERRGRPAVEH